MTPGPWRADTLHIPGEPQHGVYASGVDERRRTVAVCFGPDAAENVVVLAAAHDLWRLMGTMCSAFERVGCPSAVASTVMEAREVMRRAQVTL